jgi:type VII secretion-associated serine protease mycosin
MSKSCAAVLVGLFGAGLVTAPAAAAEPVTQPSGEQVGQARAARSAQALRPHEQLAPLGADQAWQYSTGAGVVVAVLDSGVDAEHPDLAGRVVTGYDFVDGSTDGQVDPVGHGTTVASQIAGGGDPAVGLAPEATILPVRVLDEGNRYRTAATVADGVRWAVDHGASVINLSLGGARDSGVLAEALAYAMANDVVVIACTGNRVNEEYREVWYPAREPGVVAVAGLTYEDGTARPWPASLTGPETVLTAPAVVSGAQAGGGYREVQGTSFSSALVTAVAALIRARWPELPAGDVVNRLVATANDAGAPGRDPVYGFGAVDPVGALTEQIPGVPGNPLDTKARYGASGFGAAPDQPLPTEETGQPEHSRDFSIPPREDGATEHAGGATATGQPGTPGALAGAAPDGTAVRGGEGPGEGRSWALLAALIVLPVAAAAIRYRRGSA